MLEARLVLAALRRALQQGKPSIHHSDQGVQYACTEYVPLLVAKNVRVSMAAVWEPRENGYAERLMRAIKEEEVTLHEYADFTAAKRTLGRFIDSVYNSKRIHSSQAKPEVDYVCPVRRIGQRWEPTRPPPGCCTDRSGRKPLPSTRSGEQQCDKSNLEPHGFITHSVDEVMAHYNPCPLNCCN
jgi:transposase InsO family protein